MSSDENSPNINYNEFGIDLNENGQWQGYVKYV